MVLYPNQGLVETFQRRRPATSWRWPLGCPAWRRSTVGLPGWLAEGEADWRSSDMLVAKNNNAGFVEMDDERSGKEVKKPRGAVPSRKSYCILIQEPQEGF